MYARDFWTNAGTAALAFVLFCTASALLTWFLLPYLLLAVIWFGLPLLASLS